MRVQVDVKSKDKYEVKVKVEYSSTNIKESQEMKSSNQIFGNNAIYDL